MTMKLFRACPGCNTAIQIEDAEGNIGYNSCANNKCTLHFQQWVVRDMPLNSTSHLRPLPKPRADAYGVRIKEKYELRIHENNVEVWNGFKFRNTDLIIEVKTKFNPDYLFDIEGLEQKVKMWITFS